MSDISAPGIGDDSDDGRGIYRVTRIRREGHGHGKSDMSSDVFGVEVVALGFLNVLVSPEEIARF
jgi:hypothetical protein